MNLVTLNHWNGLIPKTSLTKQVKSDSTSEQQILMTHQTLKDCAKIDIFYLRELHQRKVLMVTQEQRLLKGGVHITWENALFQEQPDIMVPLPAVSLTGVQGHKLVYKPPNVNSNLDTSI